MSDFKLMILQSNLETIAECRREWVERLREHTDPERKKGVQEIIDMLDDTMAMVKARLLSVI